MATRAETLVEMAATVTKEAITSTTWEAGAEWGEVGTPGAVGVVVWGSRGREAWEVGWEVTWAGVWAEEWDGAGWEVEWVEEWEVVWDGEGWEVETSLVAKATILVDRIEADTRAGTSGTGQGCVVAAEWGWGWVGVAA